MGALHPFEKKTLRFIRRHGLDLSSGSLLLVGVSGGPDSVALLHVLVALKEDLELRGLVVLHVNHGLRGEESDEDERFVKRLARGLGCPISTDRPDVESVLRRHGGSLEMAARRCRRSFFFREMDRWKTNRLALGHTADDQAEEILLRLLRGTGPEGLAGMGPLSREGIVRPILWSFRREVLDYLRDKDLSYREDRTNREPFCQRNRVRLELIPTLQRIFHPNIKKTLCRHAELAARDGAYWDETVAMKWADCVLKQSESMLALDRNTLRSFHPALKSRILREAFRKLGFSGGFYRVHVQAVMDLLDRSISGRGLRLPQDLHAYIEADRLILEKGKKTEEPLGLLEIPEPGRYLFASRFWDVHLLDEKPIPETVKTSPPHVAYLDAETLVWPLVLRGHGPGDRFRPLGMRTGSKKLHDFYVDAKVPRSLRHRVPILCDKEKICWVAGYRLDDRVKLTRRTRKILRVSYEEAH